MITSFCDLLRQRLREDIESRRDHLERGSGTDDYLRGEIRAMRRVLDIIVELEERARRANGDDAN